MSDPAAFEARRGRLFRLAYRMLGSVADAEDVVQEAYLRWDRAPRDDVADPAAYQARIVARLCFDQLKSARARRETYVGAWLPDPLVTLEPDEAAEDIGMALMLTLERLSPLERAAFLLHDVFEMDFDAIARVLDRSSAACRQLAARARRHVRDAEPRYRVEPDTEAAITQAFHAASRGGDLGALRSLLSEGCVLTSDGGGKRPAALNPIVGGDRVARFFVGIGEKFAYRPCAIDVVTINALPGYVTREADGLLQTTALAIEDGLVVAIYQTRNPDKLGHVAAPGPIATK